MSFARIRAPGAWVGAISTAELDAFDDHLSKAIDGNGGVYAPTLHLVIGGTFPTEFTQGLLVGNGMVVAGFSEFQQIQVDNPSFFGSTCEFGGAVTCDTTLHVVGACTFAGATFANACTFNANVHLAANTTIDGAEFTGVVAYDAGATVVGVMRLTGTGAVRYRVATASDADTHYAASATDIVMCPAATLSANRTWWIDETGAEDGMRMDLGRYEDTSAFTIAVRRTVDSVTLTTLKTTGVSAGDGIRSCVIVRRSGTWRLLHAAGEP